MAQQSWVKRVGPLQHLVGNGGALWLLASGVVLACHPALAKADNASDANRSTAVNKVYKRVGVSRLPTVMVKGQSQLHSLESIQQEEGASLTLSARQIANQLTFTPRDIFRYDPSVQTTNSGRFGLNSVNIRGLDENRVSVQVDGLEMPESYGPTNTYLKSSRMGLDIQSIDTMTVLKGQDVQKGAGFGIVDVRTHSPQDFLKPAGNDHYVSVMSGYSSADKGLVESATFANRTNDWESMLILTNRDAQNVRSHSGSGHGYHAIGDTRSQPDPGNNQNYDILAKLQKRTDTGRIGIMGEWFRASDHLNNYSNDSLMYGDYHSNDKLNRYRVSAYQYLNVDTPVFDHLHWQVDYQRQSNHNNTDMLYAFGRPYQRLIKRQFMQSTVQAKADFSKALDWLAPQNLQYGITLKQDRYYSADYDINQTTGLVKEDRYSPVGKRNSIGLYAQDRFSIADDRASITPAVRYDYYDYNLNNSHRLTSNQQYHGASGGRFTGQVGGTWTLIPQLELFGKAGVAYRSPAYQDLYYDFFESVSGFNVNILANPSLKDETSRFVEGGIRAHGSLGKVELTGFYNRYHNFINSNQMISGGAAPAGRSLYFTTLNIPRAVIQGVELSGRLNLATVLSAPDGMYVRGAGAYISGRNSTAGTRIDTIPPLKAVLGVGYEQPDHLWGAELVGTYVHSVRKGELKAANITYNPGSYATADLMGHIQLADHLTLRAGVFNLTNRKYVEWNDLTAPGASTFKGDGINRLTQPGRNYSISAQYVF